MMKKLWRFLTIERGKGARAAPRRPQGGIALIMVMIAIAITLVITTDFGTSTNIDTLASANYRDQMRSHFLARSSLDLAELIIRLQQRIDGMKQKIQITDFADSVMLAFCGSPEEIQGALGMPADLMKGLGADIGTCGVQGSIKTDDDKINLNCATQVSTSTAPTTNGQTPKTTLQAALEGLMYFPAYDPVFDEPDAENYRRDRSTQAAALIDYIDTDTMRVHDRGTTEDYGYESLKDPYRAKNYPLDTIGEIKQIRGVDDRFWALFGGAFTVYGGCKTNLSAITDTQLIAAILMLSAKDPNDPVVVNPAKLFELATLVARAREFGMSFAKTSDFVSFVKDPSAAVGALASNSSTVGGAQASQAVSTGALGTGGQKLGLVLDQAKLDSIASAGARRTYRVEAWGEVESKQKQADGSPVFPPVRSTIHGVWDTKVVNQNARKPPVPNGAWVFLREE